ncbi:MAG TPA: hypothetical protein DCY97_10785 [Marinilabiliales bacterium]|nr:hypothetical protein [Marinilabiliales bacterium]
MTIAKTIKKLFGLLAIVSCTMCEDKDSGQIPTVITGSVNDIYSTSAKAGGKVTFDGGSAITDRGIFWGDRTSPDSSGTQVSLGTGVGTFETTLTGLISGTKYYVKAYAINNLGMALGTETFFTTQINMPVVETSAVSELTPTSAKVGGTITDDGGHEITARGIYWGTQANPRLNGTSIELGTGTGDFSVTLEELSRGVTYYVVAFATNVKGTSLGSEISFSTEAVVPEVYTSTVLNIATHSATIGGNVATNGGSEVTECGVYWGTSANSETFGTKWTMGTGTGYFSDSLGGLTPGVTYYVKAFATNTIGTAYGNETSFITLGEAPMVLNLGAMDITPSGATLRASVTSNKLLTTVTFEYGLTDSYGNTLLATENPNTEQEDTILATLTGLSVEVTYHFRVKAENELGVVYSTDTTFTTVLTGITGSISDAEGNNYGTIGIGHQIWMTSNLKTVLFNDGDSIPSITADSLWSGMNSAGYCWYLNDEGYKNTYGALYNWYTVNTQKICPTDWHVPTEADWTELVDYLGGGSKAGGLLKESGTSHWKTPNEGATNEYGFTALPGGKRLDSGEFDFMQVEGNFWSSESFSTQNAFYLYLLYNYPNSLQNYANKKSGFSVRCVRD